MHAPAVFSAADRFRIHAPSMGYPICVIFRFTSEFFRRDKIINWAANRFIGRVAEDPAELRVNSHYSVFQIEENDTFRRLFKKLIELRPLRSQLLAASPKGLLRALALRDVCHRAHKLLFARFSSPGWMSNDSNMLDGTIEHLQPMLEVHPRPFCRRPTDCLPYELSVFGMSCL